MAILWGTLPTADSIIGAKAPSFIEASSEASWASHDRGSSEISTRDFSDGSALGIPLRAQTGVYLWLTRAVTAGTRVGVSEDHEEATNITQDMSRVDL